MARQIPTALPCTSGATSLARPGCPFFRWTVAAPDSACVQCFVVATLANVCPATPFVFRNYEHPLASAMQVPLRFSSELQIG